MLSLNQLLPGLVRMGVGSTVCINSWNGGEGTEKPMRTVVPTALNECEYYTSVNNILSQSSVSKLHGIKCQLIKIEYSS